MQQARSFKAYFTFCINIKLEIDMGFGKGCYYYLLLLWKEVYSTGYEYKLEKKNWLEKWTNHYYYYYTTERFEQ